MRERWLRLVRLAMSLDARNAPGLACASPRIASRSWRISDRVWIASVGGVSSQRQPSRLARSETSSSAFSGERFQTLTSCPARKRFRAMADPMSSRPTTPRRIFISLPARYAAQLFLIVGAVQRLIHDHGSRMVDPVSLRCSRSECAADAWDRSYVAPTLTLTWPFVTTSKRASALDCRSADVAT